MSTVALLLERLRGDGRFVQEHDSYRLEVAAGRPDSICFTLQDFGPQGAQITLGEGFSLDERLVFEQRRLPEPEIERIIRGVLMSQPELVGAN